MIDSARSWIEPCSQENYTKRYHRLILKLAQEGQFCSRSLKRLRELLRQFELEAEDIAPNSVRLLREQLSEQLEHAALCSAHPDRRYVLLAAVKRLELAGSTPLLSLERIIAGDESDEGEASSYVYRRRG